MERHFDQELVELKNQLLLTLLLNLTAILLRARMRAHLAGRG